MMTRGCGNNYVEYDNDDKCDHCVNGGGVVSGHDEDDGFALQN